MDYYNFYTGREFEAYRFLGAHVEGDTVCFRTFAPAAARISVIGDFSSWQEIEMAKIYDGNFWECRVPAKAGMRYKYRITRGDGSFLELRPLWFFLGASPPDGLGDRRAGQL
ncbi:GlgB N-terminal domain-containing protein [Neglectibacter timonensis]|uniref:GlgB N-terminal domain-containing protein n=1 Tax=Neglectibacter timonensis TaxID=1776382 RepID=UPI00399353FE